MLLAAAFVVGTIQADPASARVRLEDVRRSYDLARVDTLIGSLDYEASNAVPDALAEALLMKAEWLRIDYEQLADDDAKRAQLGNEIDRAAERGLNLCASAPETSEWLRRAADLRGTLIRSKFRAKKYRKKMEADADRAIELDPTNARAYVTRAKPWLFADDRHGGDIEQAVALLNHALQLDPELESAQLLLAYATEQDGKEDDALQRYRAILQANPRCKPASIAVKNLENDDPGDSK